MLCLRHNSRSFINSKIVLLSNCDSESMLETRFIAKSTGIFGYMLVTSKEIRRAFGGRLLKLFSGSISSDEFFIENIGL